MSDEQVKYVLGEQDIPTHWVNLMADLPGPAPSAPTAPGDQGASRPRGSGRHLPDGSDPPGGLG